MAHQRQAENYLLCQRKGGKVDVWGVAFWQRVRILVESRRVRMENSSRNNAANRSLNCYTRIDRSALLRLLRTRFGFNGFSPVFGTAAISNRGSRC